MRAPVARGTIVLVPFPFTDLLSTKTRPALVVSRSDRSDSDVLLASIGTYRGQFLGPSDLLIEDSHSDFRRTGLKVTSFIRLDRLMTLAADDVIGKLGLLPSDLLSGAGENLRLALEL